VVPDNPTNRLLQLSSSEDELRSVYSSSQSNSWSKNKNKKVNKKGKNKIGDKKVDKRALRILEAAERKERVKSRTRCNLV